MPCADVLNLCAASISCSIWWSGKGGDLPQRQLWFTKSVAETMVKLALHIPKHLATPTATDCQATNSIVSDAVMGLKWLSAVACALPSHAGTATTCKQHIWHLLHLLLSNQLLHRQLEAADTVNAILAPLLKDWTSAAAPLATFEPLHKLALLTLERAATDRAALLSIEGREDPSAKAKASNVAALWATLGMRTFCQCSFTVCILPLEVLVCLMSAHHAC